MSSEDTNHYSQILKISSLIGGSLAICQLLSMLRLKVAAVILGPSGLGIIGSYVAIQSLVSVIFSMGIQSSVIRDVTKAIANNDHDALGKIAKTLKRVCLVTGFIGALLIWVFSIPISNLTFDTDSYASEIAQLGLVFLIINISNGQIALIRGFQRIRNIAQLQIIAATMGAILAILCYLWMGLQGIMPSLLLIAIVQLSVSRYFVGKLPILKIRTSWRESFLLMRNILNLGLAFMWSGLLIALVAYLIRVLIAQYLNIESVGIFSAAFLISGMFINFILAAMGADFYPRLAAVASDHNQINRMVNFQTEIGLLLAIPGIIATLALAPWVIELFFTDAFFPAIDLLRWFTLGCLGQVIAWPLGFIMLALGRGKWFAATETAWNILNFGLIWIGLLLVGLEGVAISYSIHFAFVIAGLYWVARHLTGFTWSDAVIRLLFIYLPMVGLAFVCSRWLPLWPSTIVGLSLTLIVSFMCLSGLINRVGSNHKIIRAMYMIPGLQKLFGLNIKRPDGQSS